MDPLDGSFHAFDYVFALLHQQALPILVGLESFGAANNHEPVLGAREPHIDAVVLLDEAARIGPHHGNEDQIELAALRTVNRQDLVIGLVLGKMLRDGVPLRVVRRDDVDAALGELAAWGLLELFEAFSLESVDHIDFCHVAE